MVLERRTTYPNGTHAVTQLRRAGKRLCIEWDRGGSTTLRQTDPKHAIQATPDLVALPPNTVVAFVTATAFGVGDLELADMHVVLPPLEPSSASPAEADATYSEYSWSWSPAFAGLEDRSVYINGERFACVPLGQGHRSHALVPRAGPPDEDPYPTFVRTWAAWDFELNDFLSRKIGLTTPGTACDWVLDSTGATPDPTARFWEFEPDELPGYVVEWLRNRGGYFDLREVALGVLEGRRGGEVVSDQDFGWWHELAEFKLTLTLTPEEGRDLAKALREDLRREPRA